MTLLLFPLLSSQCFLLTKYSLEVSFATVADRTNRAIFNGISYVPPDIPSVLHVFELGPNAMNSSAYGNSCFVIPHLTALEIVLKNGDNGGHPLYVKFLPIHGIVVCQPTAARITAIDGHTLQLVLYF